jgi:hypothetical protein
MKKPNAYEAIGLGLLAGLAGTAAITLSQMIEMRITKRKPSTTPIDAASKVLDITAVSDTKKTAVSQEVHWAYGTTWGIARGIISMTGLKGWAADLAHFASIWGASLVMLPSLKVAPPVTEEKPKQIGIDVLHHAVYAIATGLVMDLLAPEKEDKKGRFHIL